MNRNVAIVTVILVLVVIAGYLIWLRSRFDPPVSPQPSDEITVTPEPTSLQTASPSASPTQEATGSSRQRTATPSSTRR